MYKFTNGIVVYDENTRDNYIKAGMTLVKENKDSENENARPSVGEGTQPSKSEGLREVEKRNIARSVVKNANGEVHTKVSK